MLKEAQQSQDKVTADTVPQVVISARNIGKCYRLFDNPSDRLKHQLLGRFGKNYGHEFWALHSVSFDLGKGEAVGIVGRNGSGKSTLLQILAGILEPTEGTVMTNGRISALLELGSGFNPEYTGRQNVYLASAILGIEQSEMEKRFDDIAAFADIGEFIDQPVKLYSSGMYARLAFSVAISVDPDILIVDEILAVGDYGFQQKCVARMRQLRDNGLTLVYVTHDTNAVRSICDKGLFLNEGSPVYWGNTDETVSRYLKYVREIVNQEALSSQMEISRPQKLETEIKGVLRYGIGHVQIEKVEIRNGLNEVCNTFLLGETIHINVYFKAFREMDHFSVSFLIRDMTGVDLMGTTTFDEKIDLPSLSVGSRGFVNFSFQNYLRGGNYGISIALNQVSQRNYSDNVILDSIDACANFLSIGDVNRPIHYKYYCPVIVNHYVKQ
jgi:lipopolysaccharide transport system ATP-binding protein